MSVRIGVDLDGVLADFAAAYRSVEQQLLGEAGGRTGLEQPAIALTAPQFNLDDDAGEAEGSAAAGDLRRLPLAAASRKERMQNPVWDRIRRTENFWTTLAPMHGDVVRRLNRLAATQRWSVYFITRRPATAGDSVQRQTHRWLVAQGFDLPSVLVVRGPRGALAGALGLDFMIDDSQTGCVDVISDSSARAFLVLGGTSPSRSRSVAMARKLGISPVASASEALDLIEQASAAAPGQGWIPRLSRFLRFESRGA